jgi:hypothetical protein
MMTSNQRFCLLLALAILTVSVTDAFTATRQNKASTKLSAWTMPTDMPTWTADSMSMFSSQQLRLPNVDFSSSWYTEEATAQGKKKYKE